MNATCHEEMVLGASEAGFHRLAYTAWGASDAACGTAICVHGLTRTGRDFDALAAALAGTRHVLCPDMVGRGRSDWLPEGLDYGYGQYQNDLIALIARSGARTVDWIGTSMGGILGMLLAAKPGTPLRRLVLNDVGPFIPRAALQGLAAYVGKHPYFQDFEAAVAYMRAVHAGFGPLSESQWVHLTRHAVRPVPAGGYRLAYDPRIGAPFQDVEALDDVDLWAVWDAIECPVLVLRGAESPLLTAETAAAMTRRGPGLGPGVTLATVPETGHAPALMAADQIETIRGWLADTESAFR